MAGSGCENCNGSGLAECYCPGGSMTCHGCDGEGGIVCTTCHGYGYQGRNGPRCPDCELGAVTAHGYQSGTSCDTCDGAGEVCYICAGSGLRDCPECS